MPRGLVLVPWNAGAEVQDPAFHVVPDDKQSPINEDFFTNLKAQAWWQLRLRFERTHRAVHEKGFTWRQDDLISLSSKDIPQAVLVKLKRELSQPTIGYGSRLKLMVNKTPEKTRSPNLADAVVMCFWPIKKFSMVPSFGTYGQ
jgi:phage terminase large subunit